MDLEFDKKEIRSSADHLSWIRLSMTGDIHSPRTGHCICPIDDDSVILFGGTDDNARRNDVYILNLRTQVSKMVSGMRGEVPHARSGAKAVLVEPGLMFLFGGFFGSRGPYFNDSFFLELDSMKWTRVRPPNSTYEVPMSRVDHSLLFDRETKSVITFGGASGPAYRLLRDVWSMQIRPVGEPSEWTRRHTTGDGPSCRNGHSAVLRGRNMIVYGGWTGAVTEDGTYILDIDTWTWTTVSQDSAVPRPVHPSGRYRHSVVLVENRYMYMFGGVNSEATRFGDLWELDLSTMEWKSMECGSFAPSKRTFHAMCLRRDQDRTWMYAIGGSSGAMRMNDIFRMSVRHYSPRSLFESCASLCRKLLPDLRTAVRQGLDPLLLENLMWKKDQFGVVRGSCLSPIWLRTVSSGVPPPDCDKSQICPCTAFCPQTSPSGVGEEEDCVCGHAACLHSRMKGINEDWTKVCAFLEGGAFPEEPALPVTTASGIDLLKPPSPFSDSRSIVDRRLRVLRRDGRVEEEAVAESMASDDGFADEMRIRLGVNPPGRRKTFATEVPAICLTAEFRNEWLNGLLEKLQEDNV